MTMTNVSLKKKNKKGVPREELELLSKEDLIDRIVQLEAHTYQLRNIITKKDEDLLIKGGRKPNQRKFDFSKCLKRHVLIKLLYMGWDYQGFATQEDTNRTIEFELFRALEMTCLLESRQTSNYNRCGRTDKGVSAFSQVISLDVRSRLSADEQDNLSEELPYAKLLNRLLPKDIRVVAWSPATQDLSARFDCRLREYKYFFPRGELDIDAMNKAAQFLVGTHDFRNLCKMDVGNGVTNYERRISSAAISPVDSQEEGYGMCVLSIVGAAYLWHQIRCIMGILLLIGQRKEEPEVIKRLLDIDTNPSKPQYCLAHELPLNLFRCEFDPGAARWFVDAEEMTDVVTVLQEAWALNAIKATMIRAMIAECQAMRGDASPLSEQAGGMVQGVKPKVYQPLMDRQKCEPLENRIQHYVKKQRIEVIDDSN